MTARTSPYAYNITVRECEFEGEPLFGARVKELPDVANTRSRHRKPTLWAIDNIDVVPKSHTHRIVRVRDKMA